VAMFKNLNTEDRLDKMNGQMKSHDSNGCKLALAARVKW